MGYPRFNRNTRKHLMKRVKKNSLELAVGEQMQNREERTVCICCVSEPPASATEAC